MPPWKLTIGLLPGMSIPAIEKGVLYMADTSFWGKTSPVVVYDASILLAQLHEYLNIDHDSEAYKLLHELFMSTGDCPVYELLEREYP